MAARKSGKSTVLSAPVTAKSLPKIAGVIGSPEQDAIWNEIVFGNGHVRVEALAGTGKSFTCRHAMKLLPSKKSAIYLAFGKAIAEEFKHDAPEHVEVCTLNSLGYRVCRSAFRSSKIEAYKVADMVSNMLPEEDNPAANGRRRATIAVVSQLVDLCRACLFDGENTDELLELASRYDIDLSPDMVNTVVPLVRRTLRECKETTKIIDFNDQLWLPVVLNLPTPKYDVVFVDEAQDLNACQHKLVEMILSPTGRVVIVGDSNQAIYGFRGADVDSMNNMTALLESRGTKVKTLPLTVTRRCAKSIVREAQKYVPSLQALPNAPEGEVLNLKLEKAVEDIQPGTMGVCRTNAPLTRVAYRLIKQRQVKVVIKGRDIGTGLIALIRVLGADDVPDLYGKLSDWVSRESAKYAKSRNAESQIQKIQDRADCITCLGEGATSIQQIIDRIDSIFADFDASGAPKSAVVLSSIHKAKGLEADCVYYLFPNTTCKAEKEWQKKQENHLKYVAITRAKNKLVYVGE